MRLWGNPDLAESWSKHTLCWRFWDPEGLSQGRWEGLSLKPPPSPSHLWPGTFLHSANSTCAPRCRNMKMNKPDLRPAGGRWACGETGREQACPSARGEVGVRAQSPRKPAPRRHPQQTPKRKWSNLRVLPGRMPCPWKTRGPSFHFTPLPLLQPLSLRRGHFQPRRQSWPPWFLAAGFLGRPGVGGFRLYSPCPIRELGGQEELVNPARNPWALSAPSAGAPCTPACDEKQPKAPRMKGALSMPMLRTLRGDHSCSQNPCTCQHPTPSFKLPFCLHLS